MLSELPDITQEGFVRIIEAALAIMQRDPHLGGSTPAGTIPGDPQEQIRPYPRLAVQMEGIQHYTKSVQGKRVEFDILPGQSVYWATNAWSLESWNTPSMYFGMVMHMECLRFIQVRIGHTPPEVPRTPWSYETHLPLDGAGLQAARALDQLAEKGDPSGVAGELFIALLRLGRQHLLVDDPSQTHRRALSTWRGMQRFLEENYARRITRESAAESLGLHPNYLSTLSRQVAGKSFRQALETIRMRHAQRLLGSTDLKLLRIASLCGYSDSGNFIKAFRRIVGVTPGRFRQSGRS